MEAFLDSGRVMLAAEKVYDAIVIGGGPAGLSASLILSRAMRRVLIIDSGEPRNAAAVEMHGYLGRDAIPPTLLLETGRKEIARYGVEFLSDVVESARCASGDFGFPFTTGFEVRCKSGRTAVGRKLMLATGVRDVLPEILGVRECYGKSVHHCPYCDGWEHRDQRLVAYARGAAGAAGLALSLRTWSPAVVAMSDGDDFDERERHRLMRNGIRWRTERVTGLQHDHGRLTGVELEVGGTEPADALFFNTDQFQTSELPAMLGCEFRSEQQVQSFRKQKTNIAGLYLAGDVDGDVQFVIVAAAEGAQAAVAINRELQDEDRGELDPVSLAPEERRHSE